MKTILDVQYFNTKTGKRGLAVNCLKTETLEKYKNAIDETLTKANSLNREELPWYAKDKEVVVCMKWHDRQCDKDFAWRVHPSYMEFWIYIGDNWSLSVARVFMNKY